MHERFYRIMIVLPVMDFTFINANHFRHGFIFTLINFTRLSTQSENLIKISFQELIRKSFLTHQVENIN